MPFVQSWEPPLMMASSLIVKIISLIANPLLSTCSSLLLAFTPEAQDIHVCSSLISKSYHKQITNPLIANVRSNRNK
jgi:hypothetical protein